MTAQGPRQGPSLADHAEAYAALGWPIFPCRPGGKTPLTESGCHDATADPAMVRGWWRRWPDANIGLATGHGWDVLDIDRKPAGVDARPWLRRFAAAGLLGGAVGMARTRNGGWHLYFGSAGEGNHATRAGVDYRGIGGYVILPPSRVLSDFPDEPGGYRWQSFPAGAGGPLDWSAVASLIAPQQPVRAPKTGMRLNTPPDDEKALRGILRRVENAVPGERNAVLYWAACRLSERGQLGQLARELAAAGRSAGLDPAEVAATIRSAGRGIAA